MKKWPGNKVRLSDDPSWGIYYHESSPIYLVHKCEGLLKAPHGRVAAMEEETAWRCQNCDAEAPKRVGFLAQLLGVSLRW